MARSEPQHLLANVEHLAVQCAESIGVAWAQYGRTPGDPPAWQDHAHALKALDELLATARRVRGEVEVACAEGMPREATAVAGVGLVAKHGSGKRVSWDVDGLRQAVSARLGALLSDDRTVMVDEDGAALPVREIALRVTSRTVERMIALCGMSPSASWRTTPLEELGIDPKEFKASDWAGWKVQITADVVDATAEEVTA